MWLIEYKKIKESMKLHANPQINAMIYCVRLFFVCMCANSELNYLGILLSISLFYYRINYQI